MTPDGLFFPSCATCAAWNGDMCELISDFCDDGAEWQPSEAFLEAYPQVRAMVARDAMLCGLLRDVSDKNRRLRISQLRRMVNAADAQRDDLIGYRITETAPIGSFLWRMARRKWWLAKFVAACLAEIERLRGEG